MVRVLEVARAWAVGVWGAENRRAYVIQTFNDEVAVSKQSRQAVECAQSRQAARCVQSRQAVGYVQPTPRCRGVSGDVSCD